MINKKLLLESAKRCAYIYHNVDRDGIEEKHLKFCEYREEVAIEHPKYKYKTNVMFECNDGVLYITYRGTDGDDGEWNSNFKIKKTDVLKSGRVHEGFWEGFEITRDEIMRFITAYKPWDIVTTGHSRGAPFSALAAYFSGKNSDADIKCIPIACPRFASIEWKKEFEKVIPKCNTLIYESDTVAQEPPWSWGYCHVGEIVQLGKCKTMNTVKRNISGISAIGSILAGQHWDHYPHEYIKGVESLKN